MDIAQYISKDRGAACKLSRELGVSQVAVSMWKTGVRQVPAERCPLIGLATGGAVTCEELRPDVRWDVLRNPQAATAQGV